MDSVLSWITFLPIVTAVLLLAVPKEREGLIRGATVLSMALTFIFSLVMLANFRPIAEMQMIEQAAWIPSLGISYLLGVDGISVFLILLTTLLTPLVVLSSRHAITERVKEFHILMLVLQTGMLGAFVALDLFLFYVFWEVMLLPMYLLIGVWGGHRRIYAAVKFVLYTIVGSLLMLVAILCIYFDHHAQTGQYTFSLLEIYRTSFAPARQMWYFAAFALAFAIKVPIFPLHTWLPDAHVEAPTAGSVILAGVLLKLGTYGFLRFALPLFPAAALAFQPLFLTLATVGIIYGALVAMVQTDIKKLVAYSSVSHLGYCVLGLFSFNLQGYAGSLYQMLNHGLSTGALFLLVGVIYERRHTRDIAEFGGLAQVIPWFTVVFVYVTLSSVGLPGLNGFVGEFLVLMGAFGENRLAAVISAGGVVLGAVYMLWLAKRFLFGELSNDKNKTLKDLTAREAWVLAPILVLIAYMGIQPKPMLSMMEPSLKLNLEAVSRPGRAGHSGGHGALIGADRERWALAVMGTEYRRDTASAQGGVQ
ncbi:MAG: NADH-quinone oxidoreductase subunit M [Candidatus Eisenbacteria bacterium]|nr:NADH-quinone oxidoreductase subunit M [Candidatus Eisenbacteria bacterium]